MTVPLFLVGSLPPGERCVLDGPEGHHAADVLRLRAGQELLLGDGHGGTARARVTAAGRGSLELCLLSRWYAQPPDPCLVVVQGIAKGERGELAVQAMTEVGVDAVVPWAAARSVAQWRGERGDRAHARWCATAREAAKQARRAWLPQVCPAETTAQVAQRLGAAAAGFVLHEEADARLAGVALPAAGEVVLVVGPEGGVTPEELASFIQAGAIPVRLGETVLRTSTAGVAALAVLSARLGRW